VTVAYVARLAVLRYVEEVTGNVVGQLAGLILRGFPQDEGKDLDQV
jgi:hypothetical protein